MHCRPAATGGVTTQKKTENQRKKKTRKRRKINASGSRSGGIRTRGLLVPKQRFCPFFRLFPVFFRKLSVFSAFCRLFPPVSGNFQAVLNWTFSFFHFYRFNLWLQPIGLQHGYQYRSLHSSNSRRASRYFSCSSALLKLFIYFLSSSICVF